MQSRQAFIGYHAKAFKKETDNDSSTELPAFVFIRTAEQSEPRQSADDKRQNSVRHFRYYCGF